MHRDGFNRMIGDALNGKIDLIVTKSVSRFARNTVDTLSTVRKLKDCGVEVYFEKENIYTLDSKGELILMLVGVANIMDVHVIGTGSALRGAVVCFYLANEGLSLIENAAHIGLPVPQRLKDVLAQLHNREDKDNTTDPGE